VTIRPLVAEEHASVLALLERCHLPTADLGEAKPHFLGESDAAGLVGVVGVEPLGRVGLLRSLGVRDDSRGKGLGGQLADAAEAWARGQNIEQLYLLTTTAEPFFARRGYQALARDQVDTAIHGTTEFTSACPASATVMVRRLLP
jgi:amino-acid N-acetyltransferase